MAIPQDHLVHELSAATDDFLRSFEDISDAHWIHKPAPGVWSVAETAEHTAAVFRSIERLLTSKLLEMPLAADAPPRMSDSLIVQRMFDRSKRIEAPEGVRPRGRWRTREALRADFVTSRDKLTEWLRGQSHDLRAYASPHPVLGLLDGVQWLVFAAAHTERHTRQIVELRKGMS